MIAGRSARLGCCGVAVAALFAVRWAAGAEGAPVLTAVQAKAEKLIDESTAALDAHDPVRARKLMEQAAGTGDPEAIDDLGVYIEQGVGRAPDPSKGRALMEQAAAAGSRTAKLNLGVRLMYERDPAVQARAYAMLSDAALDPKLARLTDYPLGRMALFGTGRPRDLALGVRLVEASLLADQTNRDALFLTARAYQSGWGGVTPDPRKAFGLFKRAAELGESRAQRQVGMALLQGDGAATAPREALDWFKKAAAAGNLDANIDVAVMLAKGEGVTQDATEARSWYLKAVDKGSAHALRGLGSMLAFGEGGPIDLVTGRAYLELAAERGDPNAQSVMADWSYRPSDKDRRKIDQIKQAWVSQHPPGGAGGP